LNQPSTSILIETVEELKGEKQATIIGTPIKTSMLNAALVNGAMSHVLDFDKAYERIDKVKPYIIDPSPRPAGESEYRISPRELERYVEATRCINCFCCAEACISSHKNFLGPNAVMASIVRLMDPREQAREERLELLYSEQGVYRCHTSMACSFVCPKEIDVAHFIALAKAGRFRA